jgi:predicted nucleic acid-binding Zn ribbon protein
VRRPRRIGEALERVRHEVEPATPLAAVQRVWREAVGDRIAAEAEPTAERDGVITVSCRAATWAQELDLLHDQLVARLNEALASERVLRLRFVASGGSGESR